MVQGMGRFHKEVEIKCAWGGFSSAGAGGREKEGTPLKGVP